MKRWFSGKKGLFLQGKMEEVLKKLPENSIDAVVTDPPYGLSFMGKKWDYEVPTKEQWQEVFRVLKPGGHVLSFGGTRTYHRMVVNIEDAGFEIRDQIQWLYGSGFPKSLDVSKAIDKAAGVEREVVSEGKPVKRMIPGADQDKTGSWIKDNGRTFTPQETSPATPEAQQWGGFGTALKPANEPICLARKPLSEKNVAANVLKHGTGGMNIDGCRVETKEDQRRPSAGGDNGLAGSSTFKIRARHVEEQIRHTGRFPANVIHDGSEEVLACFPDAKGQQGALTGNEPSKPAKNTYGEYKGRDACEPRGDSGSAARFFYCAKASKKDRGEGNTHPTVKPQALISYLVKLVLPPGGIVIDPFAGSGTLAKVCEDEEIRWCCIEKDEKHCDIAKERILGC